MKLPLDIYTVLPNDDYLTSFVEIMKGLDVTKYLSQPFPHVGNKGYDPKMMLNVVLFGFMEKVPSLRELEKLCRTDIRYIYLADGSTPSHQSFKRFMDKYLKVQVSDIFYDINERLKALDNIDTSALYIDGTKIEANAKKNSFVWKKATLGYQVKLFEKISKILPDVNKLVSSSHSIQPRYSSILLGEIADRLMKEASVQGITFVYGKGTRKSLLQRVFDDVLSYYLSASKYEEQLKICGDRNSYSKTDHDATMMNMKYDYYNQTGVFKPGYNIQIGVSDEYIMHLDIYSNPTDTKTFIPFMESYKEYYGELPTYPVGDAGYGSFDNYMFCIKNGMNLCMKYNYYAIKNSTKFKKNIYHILNFKKDEKGNYVCPQGHTFNIDEGEVYNEKGVYTQVHSRYSCGQCHHCPVKNKCTKSKGERVLNINVTLNQMQEEVDKILSTELGKRLKSNRSSQAEGTFGLIKQDLGYQRIRRRKTENVKLELMLLSIGYNLRKYHHKKQRDAKN